MNHWNPPGRWQSRRGQGCNLGTPPSWVWPEWQRLNESYTSLGWDGRMLGNRWALVFQAGERSRRKSTDSQLQGLSENSWVPKPGADISMRGTCREERATLGSLCHGVKKCSSKWEKSGHLNQVRSWNGIFAIFVFVWIFPLCLTFCCCWMWTTWASFHLREKSQQRERIWKCPE